MKKKNLIIALTALAVLTGCSCTTSESTSTEASEESAVALQIRREGEVSTEISVPETSTPDTTPSTSIEEQPGDPETPADEEKSKNVFVKIWEAIRDFFIRLGNWITGKGWKL